ncbi:MAG: nucleotide sugar dehydrogenase [Alphaproteobacteria bacterium]
MPETNLLNNSHIAIIGLGYVGLPVAHMLSQHFRVTGYDIDTNRIAELKNSKDTNNEIQHEELLKSKAEFTDNIKDIKGCNIYILTIPTPIDHYFQPDLTLLSDACKNIGAFIQKGDLIIFESTVYPGVSEDVCAPIIEKQSGLKSGHDFFIGYSPERINPGDTKNTLSTITKVVAGQTPQITEIMAALYGTINNGNIFKAGSIKVAEAAKAIENAQRDINVAFINEITMVLNKMGITASDALEAAKTKWNFLPFTPGLVGGHCIGVDPYYMAKAAMKHGHTPQMILAGRHINDSMGAFFANQIHDQIAPKSNILILGFTFKENISDIRNTKTIEVIRTLKQSGHNVHVHEPNADKARVKKEYGIELIEKIDDFAPYDAIGLLVAHDNYKNMPINDIANIANTNALIYDIKSIWNQYDWPANIRYKQL